VQGKALSQLKTLPQILLPTRFAVIKALMKRGLSLQVGSLPSCAPLPSSCSPERALILR